MLHAAVAGTERPRLKRGVGLIVAGVVVAGAAAVGLGALQHSAPHGGAQADVAAAGSPSASAHHTPTATPRATGSASPTHLGATAAARQGQAVSAASPAAPDKAPATHQSTAAATTKTTTAAAKSAKSTAVAAVAAASGQQILGIGSGLCISPASSGSGARLQLAQCTGAAAELWAIESDGTIRSQGLCMGLGTGGDSDGNGIAVIRTSCDGSDNQVFDLNAANDLTNAGTGNLCVDATNQGTSAGTPLQLWACGGTDNQKWKSIGS